MADTAVASASAAAAAAQSPAVPETPPQSLQQQDSLAGAVGHTPHQEPASAMDANPKNRLSGRQRLLRGLSRISSTPSLAQLATGRPRSSSTPLYGTTHSFSCVSLSPASPSASAVPSLGGAHTPMGSSYLSPQPSHADALTAPNTAPGTPGASDSPQVYTGIEQRLAIRKLDGAAAAAAIATTSASTSVALPVEIRSRKSTFNMWAKMPHEIKVHIFSYLRPRQLVRSSRACKDFYKICFDGQLWTSFDASEFYRQIPADSLAKIIVAAGPFVKDLNLRGCVQVEHYKRAEVVVKACKNLINATLEGCRNFQQSTLHSLLRTNERLARLNLTGLGAVTNTTCRIVAESCPQLEMFNVSWCEHVDARGVRAVVEKCPRLTDLRAGEVRGFYIREVAEAIFRTNNLTRLVLGGCGDLDDASLRIMMHGVNPEMDVLTDRPMVPPRKLRHLDLSRCTQITSHGLRALGHFVPELEGLQLSGCTGLTDSALEPVLATATRLTHLELEDVPQLTNAVLSEHLAKSPCAPALRHLTVSYCESLSDAGMQPVMRACRSLETVEMDNTRVSDLVLTEAAAMVRARAARSKDKLSRPRVSLNVVVYDCQNITWTGIREVLSRNAEILAPGRPQQHHRRQDRHHHQPLEADFQPNPSANNDSRDTSDGNSSGGSSSGSSSPSRTQPRRPPPKPATTQPTYPTEIISLKCFYGWQMTVDEHTKRVLRGDLAAAARLERKWAEYIQATEEAGVGGAGGRRRRRRAREAQQVHADEEEGGGFGPLGVGRRRARTAACAVM
ncbi:F-box/LRR-repeat protein 2 [Gaeumannomyces tritici R3-111a-1]|uniref:F-box/LRR-repeat protein 2 n=1 Tax=Gaeumannomyces tritici (strain R3-111a-1) TaxID=644352 RepID=J3NRP2_GAET3|nr:F-box/LRR-repeat protein 2 [Gaeumannomyces tritici R3-111a-1]EJT78848.1 F-box/LRR-repeat protein 2 [Gaeumannomyces tritici R3-111a-1]